VSTLTKVFIYLLFVAAVYCQEYDVPVMLYIKRTKYLADWKLAAWAQRTALDSYRSYTEEAEYVRG
jgi:hypothetical protein